MECLASSFAGKGFPQAQLCAYLNYLAQVLVLPDAKVRFEPACSAVPVTQRISAFRCYDRDVTFACLRAAGGVQRGRQQQLLHAWTGSLDVFYVRAYTSDARKALT
jgi:hypothetical protein